MDQNIDRDNLELLIARIEQLRTYQRDYFARRMEGDKKLSIKAEAGIDALCKEFRRRGYDPDRFKINTEQKKMDI